MQKRTILFLDTEFTGLNQDAELISIALINEAGDHSFYAEFSDYESAKLADWHHQNVLPHLLFQPTKPLPEVPAGCQMLHGNTQEITAALKNWLAQFPQIEIWADVLPYDWVLFCELFGGARQLPEHIFYIPFDFATLLKCRGLNPDMDRVALAALPEDTVRHNALQDARITRLGFQRLMADAAFLDLRS